MQCRDACFCYFYGLVVSNTTHHHRSGFLGAASYIESRYAPGRNCSVHASLLPPPIELVYVACADRIDTRPDYYTNLFDL